MECEFCNREMHLSHLENEKTVEVYDCTHCPILTSFYFKADSGEKLKVSFMLDRNEKTYIWTNNYVKGISYITDVGVSLSAVKDKDPLVLKFPKIMNINPTNVREKFSFYMVFL